MNTSNEISDRLLFYFGQEHRTWFQKLRLYIWLWFQTIEKQEKFWRVERYKCKKRAGRMFQELSKEKNILSKLIEERDRTGCWTGGTIILTKDHGIITNGRKNE